MKVLHKLLRVTGMDKHYHVYCGKQFTRPNHEHYATGRTIPEMDAKVTCPQCRKIMERADAKIEEAVTHLAGVHGVSA